MELCCGVPSYERVTLKSYVVELGSGEARVGTWFNGIGTSSYQPNQGE